MKISQNKYFCQVLVSKSIHQINFMANGIEKMAHKTVNQWLKGSNQNLTKSEKIIKFGMFNLNH